MLRLSQVISVGGKGVVQYGPGEQTLMPHLEKYREVNRTNVKVSRRRRRRRRRSQEMGQKAGRKCLR